MPDISRYGHSTNLIGVATACIASHHFNDATLALGRMVKSLLNGEGKDACRREAEDLIARYGEFQFEPYPGVASGYIVDTVQTVLHHFFNTDGFEACLVATVNQGGDADTTGALAGMLAGAHYGLEQIPARWLAALDGEIAEAIRRQTVELLRIAAEIS